MRWICRAAVATLALTLTACTTSPTGRQQLTLMSDAQLNQMGQEAFAQYQQDLPPAGQAQQRYAQCVAEAIVAVLPERERNQEWQIRVFEAEQANAFALPGGYMGVNTGLLEIVDNQDQLASVIGHEIGHVLARHANERVSTQTSTQLALSVLSSAAGLEGPGGEQLMGALGLGAQYGILLPFSRRHESEADVIGLRLMADAGFDPRASVALWENMSAQGGANPPAWMSTHPSHGQRMQGLQAEMDNALAHYEQARQAGRQPNCPRP
ncbi:M48 family metallopeptidase [Halomonas sp. MCCC 1A17488]|uniref:M48 family metallopeptidase n=1 Tax=Billgrantia sulfidoxydans TaxID=2733484 RepID=A0ABX7W7W2_9GAMM|nr:MULTISPECIES: M48 family metallopeptidase [Halomonas]MCE8017834.1 M48 family metallopeptidase [Halomonas sp. MCCC 1A17488]MCG3241167.1 M48 family metallopeptidase [Halomonas sp. MCCC 1A17488]QPP49019.1 M48 family metallopeptidase [Halomonas sp. SS10-MC5]QTP56356.1 M48 family metallopeptidase [Halomonas sulfidoxydans]